MPKKSYEEWDPRNDREFWRRVAIAAGLPPAMVLGAIFAPGAVMGALIVVGAKQVPDLFKSQDRVARERAEAETKAALRLELFRARLDDSDANVTKWMRVVHAYYALTTDPDKLPPMRKRK